jgi:hypothetical protein
MRIVQRSVFVSYSPLLAPRSNGELFAKLGPIRSREAMNAELVEMMVEARKPHPPSPSPLRREGESRAVGALLYRLTEEGLGVRANSYNANPLAHY